MLIPCGTSCVTGPEIPVFLTFFSIMISVPVNSNFMIYRTCYVIMKRSEPSCAQLGLNTTDNATITLEKEVQIVANYIHIIMELFTLIVPCILCLFIGPYSDKKGRRKILIISLAGNACSCAIKIVVAALPMLSPWYLILQGIPMIFTGGTTTFVMISFCYLIDITTTDNRGMRMGLMDASLALGGLLGLFSSSYLFLWIGYVGVYSLCFLLVILAWFYTVTFLKETINITNDEVKFFTCSHLKEMFRTTFKPREGFNRMVMLGCLTSVTLFVMAESSSGTEGLLLRSKFHWEMEKLSNYGSLRSIITIVGACMIIYVLHKLLRISEALLILVGLSSSIISTSIMLFAKCDWQVYTAAVIRVCASLILPMIRSLSSNIIPRDEIGKIFALCVAVESLLAILVGPMYTLIYTETIDIFPSGFYIIPLCIYIGLFGYFIFVAVLLRRDGTVVFIGKEEEAEAESKSSHNNNTNVKTEMSHSNKT